MSRQNLSMEKPNTKAHTPSYSLAYKQNAKARSLLCYSSYYFTIFSQQWSSCLRSPSCSSSQCRGDLRAPHRFTLPSNPSAGSLTMMSASALMQQGQPLLRKKAGGSTEKFCSGITLGLLKRRLRGTRRAPLRTLNTLNIKTLKTNCICNLI